MKQTIFITVLLSLLSVSALLQARNLPVEVNGVAFTLLRDSDEPEKLPLLSMRNTRDADAEFHLETRLVRPDGTETFNAAHDISVPAGKSREVMLFEGRPAYVKGEILLMHTRIRGSKDARGEISGIFGTPKPVPQSAGGLIGMNVHLNRYRASTRWRLLAMMKEAGITTVRVDSVFPDAAEEGKRQAAIDRMREDLLALEAFGMNSLVCIAYFHESFHRAPDKLERAYAWGKRMAEAVKGRTSFHFGNETNSGWGAYGSAAAMGALNQAFALGVAAGDPQAWRGSLGIAEGPVNYVSAFCDTGAMNYLEAIAIHPYSGSPEAGMAKAVAVRSALRARGLERQLWATEAGFHVDKGNGHLNPTTGELTGVTGFSADMQAKLLPRLFVLGAAAGIERIYWYDFFGRNDPETFWLVAPDYTPRPAYSALKNTAGQLQDTVYIDGTPFDSQIQRQLFRKPDGSRLLVCWALQENVKADFKLPAGCSAVDWLGRPAAIPADGIPTLGHGPLFISGITADAMPAVYDPQVILSGMDASDFRKPEIQRFFVKPGEKFNIPVVAFNAHPHAITAKAALQQGIPGWSAKLPGEFRVPAAGNATAYIWMEVPADAISGVEYELSIYAATQDCRLTLPFTARIQVTGNFPYAAIMNHRRTEEYPMHDPMQEARGGTGNPLLEIAGGKAVVDGKLDEWQPEEFYPLDQEINSALRDIGRISDLDWQGKAALRWDEDCLYAAFIVNDDQLCFPDFISRDWRDSDNIRILLSTGGEPGARPRNITRKDILVIATPCAPGEIDRPAVSVAALGGFQRRDAETQIKVAAKSWKNGYVLEIAIPFRLVSFKPGKGREVGISIMADDADQLHRQSVAMIRLENFTYWRSPAATGKAILK